MFVGTHDFRGGALRGDGDEVHRPHHLLLRRAPGSGDLLELKVCANGFLYNMVRAITGTVLYAAEGKFAPEDIPAILESGDRTAGRAHGAAGRTVPDKTLV